MSPRFCVFIILVVSLSCLAPSPFGFSLQQSGNQPLFLVDVNAVVVDVVVSGRGGRPVSAPLEVEDFKLFEDGVEQELVYFSRDRVPLSIVVLLDIACSAPAHELQQAALRVLSLLGPRDEISVMTVDSQVRVVSDFTLDRLRTAQAIARIGPGDNKGIRLHEAVAGGIDRLDSRPGRQALIVLSYLGRDQSYVRNAGKHARESSEAKCLDRLRQSDVRVYPISFPHPLPPQSRPGWQGREVAPFDPEAEPDLFGTLPTGSKAEEEGVKFLTKLASDSGGNFSKATHIGQLEARLREIIAELGSLYRLAFVPGNRNNHDRFRTIKVKVAVRGLQVRSRKGYFFRGD